MRDKPKILETRKAVAEVEVVRTILFTLDDDFLRAFLSASWYVHNNVGKLNTNDIYRANIACNFIFRQGLKAGEPIVIEEIVFSSIVHTLSLYVSNGGDEEDVVECAKILSSFPLEYTVTKEIAQ